MTPSDLDMPATSKIAVPLGGGTDGEMVQFEIGEEYDACRLRASYRDQVVDLMAPDFFSALCRVREIMALAGLHPICYGASLDVYCVDATRESGNGLNAHQLTMGQKPGDADLVEIFADGPDVCSSTVVDQRKYYLHWLESVQA